MNVWPTHVQTVQHATITKEVSRVYVHMVSTDPYVKTVMILLSFLILNVYNIYSTAVQILQLEFLVDGCLPLKL